MRALHQPYSVLRDAGRCWRTSARVAHASAPLPGGIAWRMHRAAACDWREEFDDATQRWIASASVLSNPRRIVLAGDPPPDDSLHRVVESAGGVGGARTHRVRFTASYRQTPNSWTPSPTIFMRAVVPCSRCARMATGRLQCAQRVQARCRGVLADRGERGAAMGNRATDARPARGSAFRRCCLRGNPGRWTSARGSS